ncbi:F0F1 ATP synthase subunit epsilon [Ahrensia kielensis]|uniref:ATP synthase epsilon chain n=1 Tax=Ahrensia kielensis TaxID=76980 RepID=A0ABU9T8K7_9HYPH
MADAFTFELVSPERLLLSEQVTQVVVPGSDGYFTVMANHAATMSTLQPGVAKVTTAEGKQEDYVIFGGFIDVLPTSCTILAESAVAVSDVNKADLDARIEAAKAEAAAAAEGEDQAKANNYLAQLTTLNQQILPA